MMQTFENANKFNKEFVDSAMKSAAAWTSGLQAIAAQSADYAKVSMERGSEAFEKVASAKSPEKVFEIQAEYAKSAFEGFVAQATKVSELYADLAKDAYKPIEGVFAKTK